ncbi:MAG: outer membrane lipoprotein carrier protein LolA [Terriglobia bacterium]
MLSLFWGLPAPGRSQSSDSRASLEQYVQRLESSYRNVRTLRAEFTQTHVWGARRRVESGTVYFARGGLMRWDYREPSPKLFLATGKQLILYVPSENQVTRSPVKSSDDVRVPFRLLLSRLNLRKVFQKIEFADDAAKLNKESRLLRAIPKGGADGAYSEVLMEVAPSFDIQRLVVVYADRSRMEFVFERIERNVTLSPSLFRFAPPPGAEIIEQR